MRKIDAHSMHNAYCVSLDAQWLLLFMLMALRAAVLL